jgi:large subunit ribosomal protein L20
MARVKRGNVARKRRKKVLKLAKGFQGSLSKLFRPAHQVVLHALNNSYKDRRRKKRDFRALWIARLNAGLRENNMTYSKFINEATKKNIKLNRKVLSELAIQYPETFKKVVETVKG